MRFEKKKEGDKGERPKKGDKKKNKKGETRMVRETQNGEKHEKERLKGGIKKRRDEMKCATRTMIFGMTKHHLS